MTAKHIEEEQVAKPGDGVRCALHEQAIADIKLALSRIEVDQGKQLARIENQTCATNGRVRSLERWKIALTATLVGLMVGMVGDGDILRNMAEAILKLNP